MKQLLILMIGIILFAKLAAQDEEPPIPNTVIQITSNTVYGKVLDSKTSRGLEAVSVQLYTVNDSLVAAMFTKPNGDFRFTNLPSVDSFKILITAIGYSNYNQTVNFKASESGGFIQKDLGNILIDQDIQTLTGVVVTGQRPGMQLGIDRRIFDVDRNLAATGGTAVDVMKNIPSVKVDVDGNVQLRNSSPQIFVDGRPTILTLEQIPADNIERVEIITNPSAKFDAASTGGIINVVLKRNKRVGLNGIASAGIGYPGILNGNLNLNARQGKFNFFVSGSYNRSGGISEGETLRQNKQNGVTQNYFNQFSGNTRQRKFGSVRFGLDFFLDNRNTISLTQGVVRGRFENEEEQEQEYLNINKIMERYGERFSEGNSAFNRNSSQFNFTHKFPQQGKELTASVNYNYGDGTNETNIANSFFYPNGSEYTPTARVRNSSTNDNDQVTFQVDFVNPSGEDKKFEVGVRSYINNYANSFASFAINNGAETRLPLSNNIEYREMVNAFYMTYTNKIKTFSYQAGLRAEHSNFEGKLLDTNKEFGYDYPNSFDRLFDALFPSIFLTKAIGEDVEMQVNYTRRIRRPSFWQLNPFLDINDPVNLSQGNPALRPEFTNSFEFNYNKEYEGGSFLGVVYYRNNQGDITRYSDTISTAQYQQINNAAIDPNAILNTFINAQATNRLGVEFALEHSFTDNFDITPSFNIEYQKVKANIGDLNLSNDGLNWEAQLTSNYKIVTENPSLFNNLGFQVSGEYESPRITPQGRNLPEYSVDVALRKEFLKDKKASVTFSVNDVFWTDRDGSIYDTDNFYQESFRRNVRSFRLNLSYRFGDADFKLFNRGNNGDEGRED